MKSKEKFLWIWQFPQNLCGAIFKKITKAKKDGDFYYINSNLGSVSLGQYIFIGSAHKDDDITKAHEKGHAKQSMLLGWLYLIVIGVPSLIWASCFKEYRKKHGISYYDFYTEKWADKLAGIERR